MVNGVSVDIRPRSANKGVGASTRSTAPAAADRINSTKVSLKDNVKLNQPQLPEEYFEYIKACEENSLSNRALGMTGAAVFSLSGGQIAATAWSAIAAGAIASGIAIGGVALVLLTGGFLCARYLSTSGKNQDKAYNKLFNSLGGMSPKQRRETLDIIGAVDKDTATALSRSM